MSSESGMSVKSTLRPSFNRRSAAAKSCCSSLYPGEQNEASSVKELAMPSSRHATTLPVAFFAAWTEKELSLNE